MEICNPYILFLSLQSRVRDLIKLPMQHRHDGNQTMDCVRIQQYKHL